jgi:hypothetical protein
MLDFMMTVFSIIFEACGDMVGLKLWSTLCFVGRPNFSMDVTEGPVL